MIRSLHSPLVCLLLGTSLLCQEKVAPPTGGSRAIEGWLIELLDRDPARARTVYEAAATAEGNSAEDQGVARARLAELDRLATPGHSPGGRRGSRNPDAGQLNLRQEFTEALAAPLGAERERKLKSLRDSISDPELQRPIQARPYMQSTLRQLREARSTTMARLNTEIARAVAERNPDELRRLQIQRYLLRRPALSRERLDQINRRPLAVIAQRQLQEKTQAAESMTRILRARRFRGLGDLSTSPLPKETEHRKLLTEARRRLAKFILEEDLSAFEFQVMEHLAARLDQLRDQGEEFAATALLARLPYYGNLFLR